MIHNTLINLKKNEKKTKQQSYQPEIARPHTFDINKKQTKTVPYMMPYQNHVYAFTLSLSLPKKWLRYLLSAIIIVRFHEVGSCLLFVFRADFHRFSLLYEFIVHQTTLHHFRRDLKFGRNYMGRYE